jgi:putative ABC transport system permease protein
MNNFIDILIFKKYFIQALRGVKINPSRTILTTLGIVIGIATVIFVLSAGEGFKSYVNNQIESFGTNTVFIETKVPSSTKARSEESSFSNGGGGSSTVPITTLKYRDLDEIKRLPNVSNAYGVAMSQQTVTYKDVLKNSFIFGSDASRFEIDRAVIEYGRAYTEAEDRALSQVAILGSQVALDLFGEKNPIGNLIKIGNYNFEVIGVYEPRGGASFMNEDDQIYVPVKTLQKKILGIDYLFYAVVELVDNKKDDITSLDMADILRRNHNIPDSSRDDFLITTQEENMEIFDTILSAIKFLLIAIASISLIVGGVGVMNIMYVAVTERIGEVGLKKALGAKNKDILYEFLMESAILTIIGGFVGVFFGAILSFATSKIVQSFGIRWDFGIPLWGIVVSVSISALIGIFFGVFPAKNAAKLNPIEALNKE